jgi:hypothetical protein
LGCLLGTPSPTTGATARTRLQSDGLLLLREHLAEPALGAQGSKVTGTKRVPVKDGQLVDGRNRREACRRLGVEPHVEELNGVDPVAYIISTNITRRHLSKGQRAMAIAKLYPEPEKGGRGKNSLKIKELNAGYVSQARTVLAWLPQAADAVLAGTKPLGEAYAEATKARAA